MVAFLISAIKIIVLLGVLITIHELGHFIVAKLCRVKVNEFAIGFGPAIWQRHGKETIYTLRLIPLGGYNSLEGEEEASEDENSFSKASIPKRIAIVLAGAVVNIIFAIGIYFTLTATAGTFISNEVEQVIDGYVAQEIGMQKGDKIIEGNGKAINSNRDLNELLENSEGKEIQLKVERKGEILIYHIEPSAVKTKVTGIYLDEKCRIVTVQKESPAEKQGIQANDVLLQVNGVAINGDTKIALQEISQKGVNTMTLTVKRGEEERIIELTPDYETTYILGVNLKEAEDTFWNRCVNGMMQTQEFLLSIVDNLKQLFTGNVGVDQMMGPVGISEVVAKTDGMREFFEMMALISLSLGVTNLLPVPALDGGKILILLIEAIRRKPFQQQTEINIQLIGFAVLIALSLYVTYNDILRIF
ncbi:MAG: PDZ domain-containing protein [Clostridia bacterium]|nr:PDZ domain-containing protein [Clostridia bacterium]